MLKRLVCTNPGDFTAMLEAAVASNPTNMYILFTGSKNATTGQSWCPDCVRADPIIESAISKVKEDTVLLTCLVDREPYRTTDYVYRKDSKIALRCVPTLMRWENNQCISRLNDGQCQNKHAVEEFFASQ